MTFAYTWFLSSLLDYTEVLSLRRSILHAQMHPRSHLPQGISFLELILAVSRDTFESQYYSFFFKLCDDGQWSGNCHSEMTMLCSQEQFIHREYGQRDWIINPESSYVTGFIPQLANLWLYFRLLRHSYPSSCQWSPLHCFISLSPWQLNAYWFSLNPKLSP